MKRAATGTGYKVPASSGGQSPDRRMQRYRVQKTQETRKYQSGAVFQFPRCARAQQLAQDQAQIERAHMN